MIKAKAIPQIERLRIRELLEAYNRKLERKGERRFTRTELAEVLFRDSDPRPSTGRKAFDPTSISTRCALISKWDSGDKIGGLRIRHLKRLAAFFGKSRLDDLVQFEEQS